MSDPSDTDTVVDDRPNHRFVHRRVTGDADGDDVDAELLYRLDDDDRLILIHTGVDDSLQGHGIGGQLVRAAIDRARAEGLTLVPWCPYARRWLREHPDAAGAVSIDWHTPPPSSDQGPDR